MRQDVDDLLAAQLVPERRHTALVARYRPAPTDDAVQEAVRVMPGMAGAIERRRWECPVLFGDAPVGLPLAVSSMADGAGRGEDLWSRSGNGSRCSGGGSRRGGAARRRAAVAGRGRAGADDHNDEGCSKQKTGPPPEPSPPTGIFMQPSPWSEDRRGGEEHRPLALGKGGGAGRSCPLSRWERVGVRAGGGGGRATLLKPDRRVTQRSPLGETERGHAPPGAHHDTSYAHISYQISGSPCGMGWNGAPRSSRRHVPAASSADCFTSNPPSV